MKKIKVSQLPVATSLQGLYTLGTDVNNNSVKVSLEFVEQKASAAATAAAAANTAANNAIAAKQAADTAASAANTAATNANTAKNNANTATTQADTARDNANTATSNANAATASATQAAQQAAAATAAANTAKNEAIAAAQEATEAAEEAIAAAATLLAHFGSVVTPSELIVVQPPRITLGNKTPVIIEARLLPEQVTQNIIFISDNRAASVTQDGRIQALELGRSTVQIIPTMNTKLTKVIQVEVIPPSLRLLNTRSQLRLTASGALRLN